MGVSIPVKYLTLTTASLLATLSCFWLMQMLISMETTRATEIAPLKIATSHLSPLRKKKIREARRKAKKALPSEPPPTPKGLPRISHTRVQTASDFFNRASLADLFDVEEIHLDVMPPVKNLIPLFVVQPIYPFAAVMKEIEGYVLVEFTVRENGTVANAIIVDSEPGRLFDDAALLAIRKFKFQPREIGGDPMPSIGTLLKFAFTLESPYAR